MLPITPFPIIEPQLGIAPSPSAYQADVPIYGHLWGAQRGGDGDRAHQTDLARISSALAAPPNSRPVGGSNPAHSIDNRAATPVASQAKRRPRHALAVSVAIQRTLHSRRNSTLARPSSTPQARPQRVILQSHKFRPFSDRLYLPTDTHANVHAFVPCLLLWKSPLAVVRTVAAVVLDALDRVARPRAPSHVGEEIHVAFRALPALADRDATTSIVLEARRVLGITALPQTAPNPVLGRLL